MDVRSLLRSLNIEFREHGESPHVTENFVGLVCPMPGCGTGGKFGMGISLDGRTATCWRCGKSWVGHVLAAASNKPLREIIPLLGELLPDNRPRTKPTGKYTIPTGAGPMEKCHRKYLQGRNIDPDYAAEMYSLGGIGMATKLSFRLFMPVHRQGQAVSWTTRAIGKTDVRYVSARPEEESCPLKSTLYGEGFVGHSVLLLEGPMSVLRLQCPGAVASYGLSITQDQLIWLSSIPNRIIGLDNASNDRKAQIKAQSVAGWLAPFPGTTSIVRFKTGTDPGDPEMSEWELKELRSMLL